ncbi:hypothetical protein [Xanthomarina sp. GH4-25]|uniref:hypothetical protein n=1 Tax=Xanthomarina sp. GH4-25 TaxID=3349335 RepID=UPI000D6812F4|nr:hypothetical protein DI383_07490 [Flavobacteriaceae bacterium LYZ1037]
MSKTLVKLTFIALCLTLFNCKNDSATFDDYKYANPGDILICDNLDTKLYVEALLSFENDIASVYGKEQKNLQFAHFFYFSEALANKADYETFVSPHTMKVFEALKKDKNLWNEDNSINYHAEIFTCILNNISVDGLQTTFNALVSTNSMKPELFGEPLKNHIKDAHRDRYMAMYVALDLFYAKLFDVDPTKITERTESNNINEELENNLNAVK